MPKKETQDFRKRNYEYNERKRKMPGKYLISWVVAIPQKGKATIRDSKKSGMIGSTQVLFKHFSAKNDANAFISNIRRNKAFYKPYDIFTMTDAQFGKICFLTREGVMDVLTTKQKSEKITIE